MIGFLNNSKLKHWRFRGRKSLASDISLPHRRISAAISTDLFLGRRGQCVRLANIETGINIGMTSVVAICTLEYFPISFSKMTTSTTVLTGVGWINILHWNTLQKCLIGYHSTKLVV